MNEHWLQSATTPIDATKSHLLDPLKADLKQFRFQSKPSLSGWRCSVAMETSWRAVNIRCVAWLKKCSMDVDKDDSWWQITGRRFNEGGGQEVSDPGVDSYQSDEHARRQVYSRELRWRAEALLLCLRLRLTDLLTDSCAAVINVTIRTWRAWWRVIVDHRCWNWAVHQEDASSVLSLGCANKD